MLHAIRSSRVGKKFDLARGSCRAGSSGVAGRRCRRALCCILRRSIARRKCDCLLCPLDIGDVLFRICIGCWLPSRSPSRSRSRRRSRRCCPTWQSCRFVIARPIARRHVLGVFVLHRLMRVVHSTACSRHGGSRRSRSLGRSWGIALRNGSNRSQAGNREQSKRCPCNRIHNDLSGASRLSSAAKLLNARSWSRYFAVRPNRTSTLSRPHHSQYSFGRNWSLRPSIAHVKVTVFYLVIPVCLIADLNFMKSG
jgi:hypothetical protein